MPDIADEAAELQAQEIAFSLTAMRRPTLASTGRCHYCDATLEGSARFCDEHCSHDWEEEQRLLRIRGAKPGTPRYSSAYQA